MRRRSKILKDDIPQGHKFSIDTIKTGEQVIKYGNPIGFAQEDIPEGTWIHTHNIKTGLDELLTYKYEKESSNLVPTSKRTFLGYCRPDKKVGIRNEIWIIPTVGCVKKIATTLEHHAQSLLCDNIDGIRAFPHPYGCSQMGDDQEYTRQILADLINHPNAGGVLVLGLGCENSNIDVLKPYIGSYDPKRVRFLIAQDCEDELQEGLHILKDLSSYVRSFHREPIDCSELIIGMKCGGSDGLSGITANPVVGAFSDLLISKGGSTILTEVPEMFGAETLLMNRCETEELFKKNSNNDQRF